MTIARPLPNPSPRPSPVHSPHGSAPTTPAGVKDRPLPTPSPRPSPVQSPHGSAPSTPGGGYFTDIAPPGPPGGLLPPSRPQPAAKRESPTASVLSAEARRRSRRSDVDTYPGGRVVINLDDETDDEDDVKSIATATSAGIAGVGANDRKGLLEKFQADVEVERVRAALKGIVEEREPRAAGDATPTRSRPNSFFYDRAHSTLHNIPTFASPVEADSPTASTPQIRSASRLFRSPPASRPASRPGSIRNVSLTAVSEDNGGQARVRPSTYHAGMAGDETVGDFAGLSLKQDTTTHPFPSVVPSARPLPSRAMTTSISSPMPMPTPSPTPTPFRSRTTSKPQRRASRIIPDVLLSLFTDSTASERSERRREASAAEDDRAVSKLKGEPARSRSRLSKPQRAGSKGSSTSGKKDKAARASPPLPEMPSLVERTSRQNGTFGIQDDGSERFSPESPSMPVGLGLHLRARDSAHSSLPTVTTPMLIPFPAPRMKPRTSSDVTSHTLDTLGTARTFAPDRGLFARDAEISTDDIPSTAVGGALGLVTMPPIIERSNAGHSSLDHASSTAIDHAATAQSAPQLGSAPDSPHTPELLTPGPIDRSAVSMVTPPHPIPKSRQEKHFNPKILDVGHEARVASQYGQVGELPHDPAGAQSRDEDDVGGLASSKSSVCSASAAVGARSSATNTVLPGPGPNAFPPLPSGLGDISSVNPSDLPILIASHLLSSHASSLLRSSTDPAAMSAEMKRLAEESLEWGKVLMSMTTRPACAPETGAASPASADPATDEMKPFTMSTSPTQASDETTIKPPTGEQYDGMPASTDPDSYTRLPPRRIPPPRLHPADTCTESKRTTPAEISRTQRTQRSESMPPEWFRRVEHLGYSGWDRLHQAEEVWKHGMAEQGGMLQVPPAVGMGVSGEGQTSREYLVLQPLSEVHDPGAVASAPTSAERHSGSNPVQEASVRRAAPPTSGRSDTRSATAEPQDTRFAPGFLGRSRSARTARPSPVATRSGISSRKLVKRPSKQSISPARIRLDSPGDKSVSDHGRDMMVDVQATARGDFAERAPNGAVGKEPRKARWWSLRR